MEDKTLTLDYYIDCSGLKIGKIVSVLGISWQSFCNKRKGKYPWKVCEMRVLGDLLNIPEENRTKIFNLNVER